MHCVTWYAAQFGVVNSGHIDTVSGGLEDDLALKPSPEMKNGVSLHGQLLTWSMLVDQICKRFFFGVSFCGNCTCG